MQSAHIALNGFQSKVLDAWQMPGTYRLVAVSKQNSQLSRQAWPQPHLARHCSQPNRSPSLLAATAKPVANADAVRAELVQAGIPEEVIAKVVAELLAVPMASEELQEVIKVCGERVFHQDPAAIHRRTSCFWKEFQGGKHATKTVLKQNIYQVSVDTMRMRAAELKAMMSWSEEERNHTLNKYPRILTIHPSALANNMRKLQAHNFSSAQALKMCASRPNLAGYDWSSPSNVQKLLYLMLFLQLTPAEVAVNPALQTYSLESRIASSCTASRLLLLIRL